MRNPLGPRRGSAGASAADKARIKTSPRHWSVTKGYRFQWWAPLFTFALLTYTVVGLVVAVAHGKSDWLAVGVSTFTIGILAWVLSMEKRRAGWRRSDFRTYPIVRAAFDDMVGAYRDAAQSGSVSDALTEAVYEAVRKHARSLEKAALAGIPSDEKQYELAAAIRDAADQVVSA